MSDYPIYFYAGFWVRFIAFVIDLIMVRAIQHILLDFPLALLKIQGDPTSSTWYFLLGVALFVSYFILVTKWTNGQTIGKMILGLRVVHWNSEELNWTTVLIREGCGRLILKVVPLLYLTLPFTRKKQQFADILCDTSVISERVAFASVDGFLRRKKEQDQVQEKAEEFSEINKKESSDDWIVSSTMTTQDEEIETEIQ